MPPLCLTPVCSFLFQVISHCIPQVPASSSTNNTQAASARVLRTLGVLLYTTIGGSVSNTGDQRVVATHDRGICCAFIRAECCSNAVGRELFLLSHTWSVDHAGIMYYLQTQARVTLQADALSTFVLQVDDLKEALQEMFKTAGVKGTPLLFLMTDGQIVNERFLIYINDILANGWISDLFPKVSTASPPKRQPMLSRQKYRCRAENN